MTNEKLIHIKLEHSEAVQSKKDILFMEMELLKFNQTVQRYKKLRIEEIKTKQKLVARIKQILLNIKKLQTNLPMPTLPRRLEPKAIENPQEKFKREVKEKMYDENIKLELREIQEKLNSLGM